MLCRAEHIQQPIPVASFHSRWCNNLFFFCQVKDVFDGDEVQLKYMEQCGDYYKWPARPDLSQESCSSIKKKLPVPKEATCTQGSYLYPNWLRKRALQGYSSFHLNENTKKY